MKKFLILVLTLVLGVSVVNAPPTQVKAFDYDITWTTTTGVGGQQLLIGNFDIPEGVLEVAITLPPTQYLDTEFFGGGGQTAVINILDDSLIQVHTIDLFTEFGYSIMGRTLNVNLPATGYLFNGTTANIILPQTYGAVPSGYYDYIVNNSSIEMLYELTDIQVTSFNSDFSLYTNDLGNVVPYYRYTTIPMRYLYPSDTLYVTISDDINIFVDDIFLQSGYLAPILSTHNSGGATLEELELGDYYDVDLGMFIIPLNDFGTHGAWYRLEFYSDFSHHADTVTSNITISTNKNDFSTIRYIFEGALYYEELVTVGVIPSTFTAPTVDTANGFYFEGWFLENGERYEFTPLYSSMFDNNVVTIYGKTGFTNPTVDFDFTDPTPQTGSGIGFMIFSLGFTSDFSRIVLYTLIVLVIVIFGVIKGLHGFSVILIVSIVTGLFMYFGLLPRIVTFVVILLLGFTGFYYLGGGVKNE